MNGSSDSRLSMDPLTEREIEVLYRISEGASNQDIANALFLSINTVKWHVRNIYEKLDVSSRTKAIKKASKIGLLNRHLDSTKNEISPYKKILPAALSSFVGREQDLKEVLGVLESHRLLTLTGPAGVGKTRLAQEVAWTLHKGDDFPDGIYFVELAPVSRPELVGGALVEGLNLSPPVGESARDTLVRFLENQQILLVIDNFEHLLVAAPFVSNLLRDVLSLKVLATSREALHLNGEQLYPVQPLAAHSSRELFLQRSKAIVPEYVPTEDDLAMIDRICTRLDHLPLAIELAVSWLKIFNLKDLYKQLEDRFRLLNHAPQDAPNRHQTLETAIDWSYNLLRDDEQVLFRRLSIFQDSRTIDAVEEVCCFDLEIDPLEGIASLLNKNLICLEEGYDDQPRFYLLETLHEYAHARLVESEEEEDLYRRHAEFFVALVEKDNDPDLYGLDQIRWLKGLKADHENLRQAYSWSRERGEVALTLRLVGCLGIFWVVMGSFDEGVHWVRESLKSVESVPVDIQADLYRVAGTIFYVCCGEHELSREYYHKALEIYTLLEDVREMGWSHVGLIGTSEMFPEERELALENLDKSIEYLTEADDQVGIAQAWCNICIHYSLSGDRGEARKAAQESLRIAKKAGNELQVINMMNTLGAFDERDGDLDSARRTYLECMSLIIDSGLEAFMAASLLIDIASSEYGLDRPRRAAVLLGAADMFYKLAANRPQTQQFKYINKLNEDVRSGLDDDLFDQNWQQGQTMTPKEAIAFALEDLVND